MFVAGRVGRQRPGSPRRKLDNANVRNVSAGGPAVKS